SCGWLFRVPLYLPSTTFQTMCHSGWLCGGGRLSLIPTRTAHHHAAKWVFPLPLSPVHRKIPAPPLPHSIIIVRATGSISCQKFHGRPHSSQTFCSACWPLKVIAATDRHPSVEASASRFRRPSA